MISVVHACLVLFMHVFPFVKRQDLPSPRREVLVNIDPVQAKFGASMYPGACMLKQNICYIDGLHCYLH